MTDFLLELLSEEIPARMQDKARADLARLFTEELAKSGLAAQAVETFATPRRLALIARGLPLETQAVSEERKGPRANAPEQALAGFLRSTGLAREQLVERDGVLFAVIEKPGRATADVIAEAVPAIIRAFPWPKSMRWGTASATTESLRWVRPLQGIVALLGNDVVAIEIDGLQSGAETVGHRFHHSGRVTIGNADDYAAKLRACHVIVDQEERKAIIRDGATAAANAAGLSLVEDEGLVAENAGLTEWPVPLLGGFDPAFLDVPREVIQLTMRTNQKYFAVNDATGTLAPHFICTANIVAADGGAKIVEGNRKVLAARLSDAKFFWEQDLKVPLEDQAAKLGQIVFHEKLGTVADKAERVAKLARWLVEQDIVKPFPFRGGVGVGESAIPTETKLPHTPALSPEGEREQLADMTETAARLCKADLVTGMVGEFPELQGVMGGYYARAQGHSDAVADAIRDHYKPVGQGDEVPTAPVTVALSLADKLDTIFAFFSINEGPTGSRDPYALRRQILGIISIVLVGDIRFSFRNILEVLGVIFHEQYAESMAQEIPGLDDLLKIYNSVRQKRDRKAFDYLENIIRESKDAFLTSLPERSDDPDDAYFRGNQERRLGAVFRTYTLWHLWFADWNDVLAVVPPTLSFASDRLKVQQREAGVRHDLIDAVFALGGEDDLVRLLARVKALQSFVETGEGTNLLAGYKRAANILKKEGFEGDGEQKSLSYTPEKEEADLLEALDAAEPRAAAAIGAEDFEGAMAALASLRAPIDAFFDKVTVNDADPEKRTARLGMLARVRDAVHRVADFSKIEG